jgi:adenylate cyclase, class 2
MVIEAELKADVHDRQAVLDGLSSRTQGRASIYRDCYYETPSRELSSRGQELRLRTIDSSDVRHLLTFKEAAVDDESGSKPEHETQIEDRNAVERTFLGLGYVVDIEFEKQCLNFRFSECGRDFLATVVQVPEIGDASFLELETMVPSADDVPAALEHIKQVFVTLGIDPVSALNPRYYQEMVTTFRSGRLMP